MQSTLKQDQTTRTLLFRYRYFLTKYNRLTTFIVPPSFLSNGSSPPSLSLSLSSQVYSIHVTFHPSLSPYIPPFLDTKPHREFQLSASFNFHCESNFFHVRRTHGKRRRRWRGHAKLRRVGRAREIAVHLIARLGRPTANTPSYLVCDNGLGTRWQSVHVPRCAHRVNFVRQGAPLVSLVGRGPARRELLRGWLTRCDGKQTTRRLQFSDNGPVDALFSETLEPSLGYWTKRKERLG